MPLALSGYTCIVHDVYNRAMPEIATELRRRGVATLLRGKATRVELPTVYNAYQYYHAEPEVHVVVDVDEVGVERAMEVVDKAAWLDERALREELKLVTFARRMLHDASFLDVNDMIAMGLMMGELDEFEI